MLKMRVFQVAFLGGLLATLAGCGAYPSAPEALGSSPVSLDIQRGGSIVIAAAKSYRTLATSADVAHVMVTVTGTSYTNSRSMAWPLSADIAFNGLTSGQYSVEVKALDRYFAVLGSVSQANVEVTAGKTTSLPLRLSLTEAASNEGSLQLGITIEDPAPAEASRPLPSPILSTQPAPAVTSFKDDFESQTQNWESTWTKSSYGTATSASSAWNRSTVSAHGGSFGATAGGSDGMVTETGTYTMTMAKVFDMSSVTAPTLRFDLANFKKMYYFQAGKFQVDASKDGGQTWTQVLDQAADQADWKGIEVDLSAFRTSTVKVRFRYVYDYYLGTQKMSAPSIDNVYLGAK